MIWYHIKSLRVTALQNGEMSERLKEPVLKTGDAQASVGSNPTLSAKSSPPDFVYKFIRRSTQEAEGAPLLRE